MFAYIKVNVSKPLCDSINMSLKWTVSFRDATSFLWLNNPMSQFSDSFVVLRRQRNTLERRWKKIGSSWVFYKYTLDNFTHYTKIILLRARLQLLEDSMTHLVRSGIKRMVFLFCKCNDLQILNVKGLREKKDIMVDFWSVEKKSVKAKFSKRMS